MTRIGVTIVVLAALALPQLAPAKEITSLQVCGAYGCVALSRANAQLFFAHPDEQASSTAIPPVGPYYALRVGIGHGVETTGTVAAYAVAGGAVSRTMEGSWTVLTPAQRGALASTGMKPFPPPQLRRVEIAGRPSADPNAYVGVIGLKQTPVPSEAGTPFQVAFHWRSSQHPWADIGYLEYLPKVDVLFGPVGFVEVPGELEVRFEREAAGLPPLPPGTVPWALAGSLAGGAALLVSAGLGLLLARRRRQGLPRREPMPA